MKNTTAFKIYNASAGSGKTFTLVKEYLSRILSSKSESYYQYLLAITFTNKAVAEMKKRILESLVSFTKPEAESAPPEMLIQIAEDLQLSQEAIRLQSKKIIKHLLHHYASFSVETIDSFNHRLIRTFARDLKLTSNFEISLDTSSLLAEAVDQLLSKAGEDSKITKVLLDFALQKTDDDKSWDISKDIASASTIIFNENEASHVAKLKNKSLADFDVFKKQLLQQKKKHSENIYAISEETLQLIDESGLEHSDFNRSSFPKYLLKLKDGDFNVNLDYAWQISFGEKPLYTATTLKKSPDIAEIIDDLTPVFTENFKTTKNAIFQFRFFESIIKNIAPLFVINLVQKEIEDIKLEKNILPISEFNALINNEIKNQPAPFIYERLGEKYRHFFIDEFQDTSQLQWENLIPLISNAISQYDRTETPGSLLLAGDAKQSIYRWRGGLPEQFMDLYADQNPFPSSPKEVLNLETNYRSGKNIIDFNNQLFSFISNYFGNSTHQELYKIGNDQKFNKMHGGFVRLTFLEKFVKKDQKDIYAQCILETIKELKSKGFEEKDMCILTRNNKDGVIISSYLMANNIPVISSETLLLESSIMVQGLVNTLKLSIYPENNEAKIKILEFLYVHLSPNEDEHSFYSGLLKTTNLEFEQILKAYQINLSFEFLKSLTVYECCEYLIRQFEMAENADAYLFSFMDFVYEFEQQPQANKINFLETWETKKDKASIPANEGSRAVQIMTIHKAKGLEFPIVLFPYADLKIYDAKFDKLWYPLPADYNFDEAQINYKKELADYGEIGATLFMEHQNKLELDNLNLLYVALTRASEQLHVFAQQPTPIANNTPESYNQFFGEFLKQSGAWNETQFIYEYGEILKPNRSDEIEVPKQTASRYISISPADHNLKVIANQSAVIEATTQKAILEGNILHDIMAEIYTEEDIASVFDSLKERGIHTSEEIHLLQSKVMSIISNSLINQYFKPFVQVENEREIITASGMLLRPDRLNFNRDGSVTVIDYKTGEPNYHHEDQINSYASAIEDMGKRVSDKLLVYTNETEIVINKV